MATLFDFLKRQTFILTRNYDNPSVKKGSEIKAISISGSETVGNVIKSPSGVSQKNSNTRNIRFRSVDLVLKGPSVDENYLKFSTFVPEMCTKGLFKDSPQCLIYLDLNNGFITFSDNALQLLNIKQGSRINFFSDKVGRIRIVNTGEHRKGYEVKGNKIEDKELTHSIYLNYLHPVSRYQPLYLRLDTRKVILKDVGISHLLWVEAERKNKKFPLKKTLVNKAKDGDAYIITTILDDGTKAIVDTKDLALMANFESLMEDLREPIESQNEGEIPLAEVPTEDRTRRRERNRPSRADLARVFSARSNSSTVELE